MGAFTKWGRIAAAAGSVALLSVETVFLESPKPVESTQQRQQTEEQTKLAAAVEEKKKVLQLQQKEVKARSSKAPKMAPQFDGLNFYETFIGSAQR